MNSHIPPQSILHRAAIICAVLFFVNGMPFCHGQKTTGRIGTGGLQRYKSGEWGLVKGQYLNSTSEDQTMTSIINLASGARNQYVRSIVVPANASRTSQWPIFIEPTTGRGFEFEYMNVSNSDGRETIDRREGEEILQSFVAASGRQQNGNPGYCLNLFSDELSDQNSTNIGRMIAGFRAAAGIPKMSVDFRRSAIDGRTEALGCISQAIISSSDLHNDPETCEAIQFWIQRGGRALLMMDLMGEESTRALLGDVLPFTIVDQTNPMNLQLKHHVQTGGLLLESDLSYERSFEEPVRMTRAVFPKGRVVWSVDGWPMLLKLRLGSGTIFVATISPHVFLKDESDIVKLSPASTQMLADLFQSNPEADVLSEQGMAAAAQSRIGYSIPARTLPIVVLSVFLLALGLAGWLLTRKERQTWLTIVAPAIALLATIPGIAVGLASRTTAEATLLETRIVDASSGQSAMVADGVTTVYQPGSDSIKVKLQDAALMRSSALSEFGKQRSRFVWDDLGDYEWQDFSQPVGITDYTQRSVVRLPDPLTARTDFTNDRLKIQLSNGDILKPEDALIASMGVERMVARPLGDGILESGSADLLTPGEISNETLVSDEQIARKRLYDEMFNNEDRLVPFPPKPSLLFWTTQLPGVIKTDDGTAADTEILRHETATLMVVPLDINPPEIGETITILPALLPYVSVKDSDGAVGSAYFNRRRQWIDRPKGSSIVLKFSVPEACHPFEFETAEVQLRIRAGSRKVKVETGSVGNFSVVESLSSPVGNFTINLPAGTLNSASNEAIFVRIDVSDAGAESDTTGGSESEVQDSYWRVERLLMTITGHKTSLLNTENKEAK